jgi:hypothetical protein
MERALAIALAATLIVAGAAPARASDPHEE